MKKVKVYLGVFLLFLMLILFTTWKTGAAGFRPFTAFVYLFSFFGVLATALAHAGDKHLEPYKELIGDVTLYGGVTILIVSSIV